jgi:hypothetical protein
MHVLPQAGEPPTLTEGKIQEAVGPQLFLRGRKKLREQDVSVISLIDSTLTGGSIWFTIQNGKSVEVPQPGGSP